MRAAIRSGFFGGALSFTTTQEVPTFSPEKNPKEVLVSVRSAAINPVDYKMPKIVLGPVYGLDVSGVVQQVGSDVTDFKVGDAVFGRAKGTLAEYCVSSAETMAKKSDALTFSEAAALPIAYVTSLNGLKTARVTKGSSVLVIGASGGCGIAALHLAKAMGAERIAAICSGKNTNLVKEAGATEVIDYTKEEELETFFRENHGKFDCVYDTATGSGHGEAYTSVSMPLLMENTGEYLQLNGGATVWIRALTKSLPKHQHLVITDMTKANLEEVDSLLQESGAKPHLSPHPFTEQGIEDGFDLLKSRRATGKVVFDVSTST